MALVTLTSVIFSDGTTGLPLFIVKLNSVLHRVVKIGNIEVAETISDCLQSGISITLLEEVANVDYYIFFNGTKNFVNDFNHLKVGTHNELLLLDGYKIHMTY